MSQLWQVLDENRGLTLSRAGWRERLGYDQDREWELLTATGEVSAAIPVPGRRFERYIVTEVADGEFEGLNNLTDEIVPLERSDLVCFEFDVSKLAKMLAELIGFTPRIQKLGNPVHRYQIGQYGKLDGAGFSLFFVKANSADHVDICIDTLIVMHPHPFVMFVTTDAMLGERSRRIVSQQTNRLILTLDASLVLNEEQQWTLSQQARDAIVAFRDQVCPVVDRASEVVRFDTPESAAWRDVSLRFLDTESLTVSVKGKRSVVTYVDLGLVDKRNGRPDVQWRLLQDFALSHGLMTWDSPGASRKNQKRKEYLAQQLKKFFAIEQEPFELTSNRQGWRCVFAVTSDC
ncbi:MAG: hypothetical protein SGI77_20585 [Pirellulaceae bacterium]|nr:hypothetical protein [Pirellulaceae bacterium]